MAKKKSNLESSLELTFAWQWKHLAGRDAPDPVRQFAFHGERKWRFDYAWPNHKVAVECEGGVFVPIAKGVGGHTSIAGILRDVEKYNAAAELGWAVLRVTAKELKRSPVQFVELVRRVLVSRAELALHEHTLHRLVLAEQRIAELEAAR